MTDIAGEIQAAASNVANDRQIAKLKSQLRETEEKYRHAVEQLEDAERRAEFCEDIGRQPKPEQWEKLKGVGGESTAVLITTDWHVEERVDPETVNRFNEYSPAIAEKRIKTMFQKGVELVEFARHFTTINELVVATLGDAITGYIHDELQESNYLSPSEACLFYGDRFTSGVELLKRETNVKRIIIPTCNGNHGRTTAKRRISTAYKNSYEWLTYNFLSRYYSGDPTVKWKIEKGYHNWLTIQGHDVRFHHGDAIRYQGGVGGISIPVNKKIAAWNKRKTAAYDFFGHWHQFQQDWRWVSCGCLIGYNAFALSIGADYQPPTQTFAVISKKRGLVLAMPVFCE